MAWWVKQSPLGACPPTWGPRRVFVHCVWVRWPVPHSLSSGAGGTVGGCWEVQAGMFVRSSLPAARFCWWDPSGEAHSPWARQTSLCSG